MIYLDNAATTRMKPEVRAAMEPFLDRDYGNASSLHAAGRRARRALEDARETVAACLGADPKEIVFTSGATESNALSILGTAEALRSRGDHLVTSEIEHPSVLEAVARLEGQGWRVTRVPVDAEGLVDPVRVATAITPRTVFLSIMSLNNEVGSMQPMAELRKTAKGLVFHTDAAQAVGKIPVQVGNVDLLTFSAHKMHGPKGVGGLWIRKGTPLTPQLRGGAQEFETRAGTENVAGIVGLATAMKLACADRAADAGRMERLRERLREGLEGLGGARVSGPETRRSPHILNIAFEGVDGEAAILSMDAAGVCVSSGSACASLSRQPSHVLKAMGVPDDVARGSLRFSLSSLTTSEDIDAALAAVPAVIRRLRKISTVER
ncbi:MAG TPA: cysteine desulfurase family protein [Planctomycetota bacterium]|nr:cysteine desulfurase family protein [Planctomycetota bacterium]